MSLCSWERLLPAGFPQDVELPAEVLVGADVPAVAGASAVETHAAGLGAVLRVPPRGEPGRVALQMH